MIATLVVAVALVVLGAALRMCGWLHWGVHTEHAGPGRVRFVSFFRGAGYVARLRRGRGWDGRPLDDPGWRPNIYIPGFTIYWRTHKSTRPGPANPYAYRDPRPVGRFRITRNPNRPVC